MTLFNKKILHRKHGMIVPNACLIGYFCVTVHHLNQTALHRNTRCYNVTVFFCGQMQSQPVAYQAIIHI